MSVDDHLKRRIYTTDRSQHPVAGALPIRRRGGDPEVLCAVKIRAARLGKGDSERIPLRRPAEFLAEVEGSA